MFQLTKIDDPRRWPSTKPQRTQSCTKLYMRNEFLLVKLSALVPLWQAFSPPGTAKLDANRKIRFKNFSISVFPIWIIAFLLFLGSCSERQTILKEIRIAEKKTSDKNSDQSQLLLKIGKFALSHPKDVEMQFEYISDLFKAGYISSALNSASMLSVKFPDYTKFKELIRDCQLKLSLVPAKGINAKFSALISRNGAEEEILTVFRRIQSLDSAISKSNPKISSLFMERGKEYMQLENYSASSWDFNKAIQLDSLNSEALYNASFLKMK